MKLIVVKEDNSEKILADNLEQSDIDAITKLLIMRLTNKKLKKII